MKTAAKKPKSAQHPRKPPKKLIDDLKSKFMLPGSRLNHMDYRLVLDGVWRAELAKPFAAEALKHRERFEDIFNEHHIAAMIRALGKHETNYYNKYGQRLVCDSFEAQCWLEIWQQVRSLLNCDLGGMQGRLCYAAMTALAVNAGFEEGAFQ